MLTVAFPRFTFNVFTKDEGVLGMADLYLKILVAHFIWSAIRSCIDGRLGTMENRMASLLYKQAVELEMCERILADSLELDEAYLRRKRAESIDSVKRTNGQLRFEQVARHLEDD